jgi:hypothetical protein
LSFSPDQAIIAGIITKLKLEGLELETEDDIAGVLGAHIDRKVDRTIHLAQTGLIDRIIKALDLQPDQHPKQTPCKKICLDADLDGEPPHATYKYRSVVGQVRYLNGRSRPDIKFAYRKCARFSNNPKRSHERALEHIGLYLKGTRKNGLILRPEDIGNAPIDCYVDADFAGLWDFEDKQDPTSEDPNRMCYLCS